VNILNESSCGEEVAVAVLGYCTCALCGAEVPYRPVGPIIINKVSAHSLQLEWRPPMDDGGEPVLGYAIEMSEGGSSWRKVSSRHHHVLPHNQYIVSQWTENYLFYLSYHSPLPSCYVAECLQCCRQVGYTSSRDTRFTIAGLTEGATYFFRVAAENAQGFSKPLQSDCVVPTKPISEY
jgi:hypothetical protein